MTPQEARAEFRAIEKAVGPLADTHISLNRGRIGKNFHGTLYIDGVTGSARLRVEGDELDEVAAAMRAAWAEHEDAHVAEQIRKMALAIIRLTYDQGECTDAAIRADGFTDADLERYGAAAIERANEMAERGPFAIRKTRGGNGAPAGAVATLSETAP